VIDAASHKASRPQRVVISFYSTNVVQSCRHRTCRTTTAIPLLLLLLLLVSADGDGGDKKSAGEGGWWEALVTFCSYKFP